jgi:hypothetical protein
MHANEPSALILYEVLSRIAYFAKCFSMRNKEALSVAERKGFP